jgi:hypothetical protein
LALQPVPDRFQSLPCRQLQHFTCRRVGAFLVVNLHRMSPSDMRTATIQAILPEQVGRKTPVLHDTDFVGYYHFNQTANKIIYIGMDD